LRSSISSNIIKYGTIIALFLIFLTFSIIIPGFANKTNLLNILKQIALLTIISEGFTMCLIVGELDLSFANVASLSSVVVAGLILKGVNPAFSILLALCVGAIFGIVNGLLITKVGILSLITTLATGIIAGGMVYFYTKGVSFYGEMPQSFLNLARGSFLGIPSLVIFMFIIVIFAHIFINRTVPGRHMEATGGNRLAARLSGINTDLYKILGMTFSSLGAALTGILLTARLGSANPEGASGFLMDGFATALLGMTVLTVGKPSPIGTFVGALLIGILNNGMTLLGSPYYVQDITKGVIIILAVTITSFQAKRLEGG